MKVKVHEVEYLNREATGHPKEFEFFLEKNIADDDNLLAKEVTKLIFNLTGEYILTCTIDVD